MFLIFSINWKDKYFSVHSQLHPQLIIFKSYMKIPCLLETKQTNKQKTEMWDRTIKPFTKTRVSFNKKVLCFHQISKLWSHLIDILFQTGLICFLKQICDSSQGEHVTNKGNLWLPDHDYQTMEVLFSALSQP